MTMRISLVLTLFYCAFLFSSHQVHCNGDEDALLQGVNKYRQSLKLSNLTKSSKAACLADKIADDLQFHNWHGPGEFSGCDPTGTVARLVNFRKRLMKCKIELNATTNAAILPVNMPKLNGSVLLTNYTQSSYAKFLRNSNFSSAGAGVKGDWIVLILTAADGSFSAAAGLLAAKSLVVLVVGLFVTLLSS